MHLTAVISYDVSPAWLALTRTERNDLRTRHAGPILARHAATVRARFFDAECFSAGPSDFVLLEFDATHLRDYYFVVEALRDTPLISEGYLRFERILLGIEGGFEAYEAATTTL